MSVATRLPEYDIVRCIGVGARAKIYLAHDPRGRVVAVKYLKISTRSDESGLRQMIAEHNVARRFNHPNLRKTYDLRIHRRWMRPVDASLIMEYVDGTVLHEYARQVGLPELLEAVRQAAIGLQEMHRMGLVHADVKPHNILVDRSGVAKLIDFGQSAPIGEAKRKIQGTMDFIAPEQVQREPLDPRTDVFALGATLYWVLTGKPVPTELNQQLIVHPEEVMNRRRFDSPEWGDLNLPIGLVRLVEQCCQPERELRPPDMAAVISRIELIQAMLQRQARGVGGDGQDVAKAG